MGTMLLSGQGERTSQIGCLRSCDLKLSLACYVSASLPGVEQNMAWAAHWFEQAAIIPSSDAKDGRSSHRPSSCRVFRSMCLPV